MAQEQTNLIQQGSTIELQPGFKPGFRVGAGYNCKYDDWWVDALYTWYQTRKKVEVTDPDALLPNNALIPLVLLNPISGLVTATNFNAQWKLHYNVVDLELGRNFYVSKHLALNPFASLRGAWMLQKITTFSIGKLVSSSQPNSPVNVTTSQKQTFWGVGPRLGLNTHWLFGMSGFGFSLNGCASLLYSGFSYTQASFLSSSLGTTTTGSFKNSFKRIRANAELFAGFDYGHCWKDQVLYLDVYAGYSAVYWWNQNLMITANNLYPSGDLLFHGLTLGFDLEF